VKKKIIFLKAVSKVSLLVQPVLFQKEEKRADAKATTYLVSVPSSKGL